MFGVQLLFEKIINLFIKIKWLCNLELLCIPALKVAFTRAKTEYILVVASSNVAFFNKIAMPSDF